MAELCKTYTTCHFLCDNLNRSVELVCDPVRIHAYLTANKNNFLETENYDLDNTTLHSNISTDFCEETNYTVDDSYTFGFVIFGLLVCGFGIFTNFFVIFVLIKYANLSKKPTNVYLLSLSVSDMLGVLCGPPLLLQSWFLQWPFVENDISNILFKGWTIFCDKNEKKAFF